MDKLKDVKELLAFGMALITATGKSLEDGKWDFLDVTNFIPVVSTVNDALAGIDTIPATLAGLNSADQLELITWFEAKFDLKNNNAEEIVETLFRGVLPLAKLVFKLKK